MSTNNKFEQLITYIINEDEAKAKALFHSIVVEKSRDIYESLVDEDQFPVQRGRGADSLGDEISDHKDTIEGDEEGMQEAEGDDEFEVPADDEFGADEEGADEFGADDMGAEEMGAEGGEEELEDRVMDLEDAIDELKAEFDELMAGEENEEENISDIHDADGAEDEFGDEEDESEFDADEAEPEEEKMESASIYEAKPKKGVNPFAKKDEKADKEDEKDVKESRKSPADLMREYVEKVTAVKPVEGDAVGASSEKVAVNKKSTQISGKNDMGGSSANIARGGSEQSPDGTSPKKASNYATKGETQVPHAGEFENRPGAKAGSTFKKAAKPAAKEGATTDGSVPVAKNSVEPGGKPGFKG